jgi:hypothetical protein
MNFLPASAMSPPLCNTLAHAPPLQVSIELLI